MTTPGFDDDAGLGEAVEDLAVEKLIAELGIEALAIALSVADRWAVLKLGEIDDEGVSDASARARVLDHPGV